MIKIRNKRIALLLVLTMLATMFVGVGTASAAIGDFKVTSEYSWVKANEVTEDVAIITVECDNVSPATMDELIIEINLPEDTDVEFDARPTTDTGDVVSWNAKTVVIETGLTSFAKGDVIVIDGIDLDVAKGVTGNINATLRMFAQNGNKVVFDTEKTVRIARIGSGDITVSAAKAKSVYVGSNQKGANITFREIGPAAFNDMDGDIKLTILSSGVTWHDGDTNPTYCDADWSKDTDKVAYVEIWGDNAAQISRVVLTPLFKVSPSATGEIKVRVSGDGIETETFVVGNVGESEVVVTVEDADEDFVYRGQVATFDDVTVNLDPKNDDLDDTDWFSITLPDGLKFADVENPVDGDNVAVYEELIKSDKTAWFTFDTDVDDDFDLTDFVIVADADAALGDLAITFDGAVEGTYVIGSVKDAFTVTTTPFALQTGLTSVQGADIVITETADGALKRSGDGYYEYDAADDDEGDWKGYGAFSLVLPAGVTWDGVPTVEVTEGDLEIDDVWLGEDFRELYFDIDELSNIESVITLSDVRYTVLSQPGLGDLNILIGGGVGDWGYNIASSKPLVKTAIGTVATNPTAVYVIGAPTFTVNGAVQSVVTPSYIKDARTYLAIRDIATGLGIDPMNVLWDAASSKVTLIKGTKVVQVQIGSTVMNVNGVAVAMDVAPEISNGRTMLPAAFIAQAFGATASWDAATQTVTIK